MNGNVVTVSGFVQHRKPSRRMHRSWRSAARARTVNHQFTSLQAGPHCCVVALPRFQHSGASVCVEVRFVDHHAP